MAVDKVDTIARTEEQVAKLYDLVRGIGGLTWRAEILEDGRTALRKENEQQNLRIERLEKIVASMAEGNYGDEARHWVRTLREGQEEATQEDTKMSYGRTELKIERKPSPNGRYAFTLSFLMNGEWRACNYDNDKGRLREWALAEIAAGTFAGPLIEPRAREGKQ